MKMSRSKGFIRIGIIMVVGAMILEGMNIYRDNRSRKRAEAIAVTLEQQMNTGKDIGNDNIVIDNEKYCGMLEIPKINVVLPVASEYSYEQMALSLCKYSGNISDGNMILCGHNNKSFLGKLNNVFEGDSVSFIDCKGTKYEYVVNETEYVGGNEVTKLTEGGIDWELSVFTCNYSGNKRYVLRCQLK